MCLKTLHDKARNLGLGAMYEAHMERDGFRDLFDEGSAEWPTSALPEKVVALRAFELAGVSVEEIVGHYRETLGQQSGSDAVVARLPATMRLYRDAGFAPALPTDIEAAIGSCA